MKKIGFGVIPQNYDSLPLKIIEYKKKRAQASDGDQVKDQRYSDRNDLIK